jgi:hypothetical protein
MKPETIPSPKLPDEITMTSDDALSAPAPTVKQITEVSRILRTLHLRMQAAGGFPRGERCTAGMKEVKPGERALCATWRWNGGLSTHEINLYNSTLHTMAPGAYANKRALTRTVLNLYQHERGHALFTERNPAATKAGIVAAGNPAFPFVNILEDCRIEHRMREHVGFRFDWRGLIVEPESENPWGDSEGWGFLRFALACKLAINTARRGITKQALILHVRNTLADISVRPDGTLHNPWAPVPTGAKAGDIIDFSEVRPYAAHGFNGSLLSAIVCIVGDYVCGLDDFWDRISSMLNTWRNKGLPVPPSKEPPPGSEPGAGGMPGGSPSPDGSGGDMGMDNESTADGTSSDRADQSEIKRIRDIDGSKAPSGDMSEMTGSARDTGTFIHDTSGKGHEGLGPMKSAAGGNPLRVSYGDGCFGANYDPKNGAYPEQFNDAYGEKCADILRAAFPGLSAARTADPCGEVDMERFISRTPEMFIRKRPGYGKEGDVILVIDGSGSMSGRWRQYGASLMNGLVRLRRMGALRRLRVILTQSQSTRVFGEVTDYDTALKISCGANNEGLWAAYETIARDGMIDAPGIQTLVITDGDITDVHPSLALAHAAGFYPIGVFCGHHSKADKVRPFFDQFIARKTPEECWAEIARLF